MKLKLLISISCLSVLIGCSSFNATIFRSERLAATTTKAAVHSFNVYYVEAAKTIKDSNTLAHLESTKAQLYLYSKNMAATLTVTEELRKAYVTNSADSNKIALLIALETLNSQSTNIVNLVRSFMTQPKP